MPRWVAIDCFPESVRDYAPSYAIVAIDVIRATTTAITAVATGRRCFPVPSIQAAHRLAKKLSQPLLAGENGGDIPAGFDLNNSPAELAVMGDIHRPVILLSSSGTRLLHEAGRDSKAVFLACLRNAASLADHLAANYDRVAIIGAGSRSEFREEDQMCCAWIAKDLLDAGFSPLNHRTKEVVRQWRDAGLREILHGKSIAYLRNSGQWRDLDYILSHVNDLHQIFALRYGEVIMGGEAHLRVPVGSRASAGPDAGMIKGW